MRICFIGEANSAHMEKWCGWFLSRGHEVHMISFTDGKLPGVVFHRIDLGLSGSESDLAKLKYLTQGKRIRAIRQLRGYSPKELGIRAGMSPKSAGSRIARYEDGRCVPRKETLFRIAKALIVCPMAVAPYTGRDPASLALNDFVFVIRGEP